MSFDSATGQPQGLDYARLTALLIEAVKQQQAENAALKARLEAIERRLGGNAIK